MPTYLVLKRKPSVSRKPRVLVGVAKSVSKKAVGRNKLKRRIKAVCQPIAKSEGKDFFVIAKPGAGELSFKALKKQIINLVET